MKHLFLLLTLSLSLFAQTANPQLSDTEKATYAALVNEQKDIAYQEEILRLRKENLTLKVNAFVKDVQTNHPGYQLGQDGALVKVPEKKDAKDK